MGAGKEERVVARRQDEDDAAGLAADLLAHAGQPERAAAEAAGGEEFGRVAGEEMGGFGQRQDFGRERVGSGARVGRGELLGVACDGVTAARDDGEAVGQGGRRPAFGRMSRLHENGIGDNFVHGPNSTGVVMMGLVSGMPRRIAEEQTIA